MRTPSLLPPAIRRRATPVTLMLILAFAASPVLPAQAPTALPTATLEDQFGRATDLTALRGTPVVVFAADRDGFDALAKWVARVRTLAPATVQVLSLADLRSAPRLLRGVIRGGMPRDTTRRVLLDWGGALARPVRGEKQPLVAAVYDARGMLVTTTPLGLTGPDDATVSALLKATEGR
ncbi:MAG: hypothetical protein SFW08_09970 [Gemmatimonadaceae bacterium]|nr:hypothetical protein [Gemmatimonadaceae bacterium]